MDGSWFEERLAGMCIACIGPMAVAGLLVGVRGRMSVADVALALVLPVIQAAQVGRFVCIPTKGVGVGIEHRLAAIALADHLGSVLVARAR